MVEVFYIETTSGGYDVGVTNFGVYHKLTGTFIWDKGYPPRVFVYDFNNFFTPVN